MCICQASDFFRPCIVSYDKVSGVLKNCFRKTKHHQRAILGLRGPFVLPLIGPCARPSVCKNFYFSSFFSYSYSLTLLECLSKTTATCKSISILSYFLTFILGYKSKIASFLLRKCPLSILEIGGIESVWHAA